MILADTSVWIEFLRKGNERMKALLLEGQVVTHPVIFGELSCGHIEKRKIFLESLGDLPSVREATHEEVLSFLEREKLFGKGVGYGDLQILCSAILHHTSLWTLDKGLAALARRFSVSA